MDWNGLIKVIKIKTGKQNKIDLWEWILLAQSLLGKGNYPFSTYPTFSERPLNEYAIIKTLKKKLRFQFSYGKTWYGFLIEFGNIEKCNFWIFFFNRKFGKTNMEATVMEYFLSKVAGCNKYLSMTTVRIFIAILLSY